MASLKSVLQAQLPAYREQVKALVRDHGERVISEVTIAQAYGGMRGVKALICDTTTVSPTEGLIIRGVPLAKVADCKPEQMLWLLLTGELPDDASLAELTRELHARSEVPGYVLDALRALPRSSHPMAMQSLGLLALEEGSRFRSAYEQGMAKSDFWEVVLEDSLDLLAKLPVLTAAVYRIKYGLGDPLPSDASLDWGGHFAHLLGAEKASPHLAGLIRLYLNLHADHESGNVSANLAHTCGSALSDPYYAVSAGLNGLAGPLHGLAPQECLYFHQAVLDKFGGLPTAEQLTQYAWDTLNAGRVIPGFGHAVLRCTDPRYTACQEYGRAACPDHPLFQLADLMYRVIPGVLTEHGKAKNVNPNVDAISGVMMYALGLEQPQFFTAIFSVSRAIGMCAQMVLNRALGTPITRPKSVTTEWVRQQVGG